MTEKPLNEDTVTMEEEELVKSSDEKNAPTDTEDFVSDGEEIIDDEGQNLSALEAERDELNQRLLRLQADFENFKRRTREERVRDRQFRAQDLIENILPVLDNFARALGTTTEHEESAALKQGMEMVYRQLTESLKQEGVTEIEAEGQPFDPNMHQAVMQVESDEHDSNMVIEVLQAGYTLNGRVIRPAMVKVSQ